MGFGSANVNGSNEGFESFGLVKLKTPKKEGETTELVVRLLPPMKSYAETGKWGFYYKQHFGYSGVNPNNPTKTRARPFSCTQEKDGDGNITTICAECDKIETKRNEKQKLSDKGESTEQLNDWLFRHNLNCKVWINAMTPDGKFIVLQLTHKTVKTVLKPFLKKLDEKFNINALDPNKGVWLKFTRTGVGRDATDKVECDTETRVLEDGTEAEVRKMSVMTAEQVEKALKICPDLAKDPGNGMVKVLTVAQIRELTKCDEDPRSVDAIFGDKPVAKASASAPEENYDDSDEESAPTAVVQNAAPPPDSSPVVEDEEAQLMAQMAALKARKAKEAAEKTKQTTPSTPATPPKMAASQSAPEEFLALFSPK